MLDNMKPLEKGFRFLDVAIEVHFLCVFFAAIHLLSLFYYLAAVIVSLLVILLIQITNFHYAF